MAEQSYSGSTYTIIVPDGWVRIPPNLVTKRMAEVSSDRTLRFPYAFQLEVNKTWFSYPYVVVQEIDYPGEKEPTEKEIEEIAKHAGGSGSMPQLDMTNHRFATAIKQNVPGVGPISGQINGHIGRTQAVNINVYARDGDFNTYAAQFNQINNSFQWDRNQEYQATSAGTSNQLLPRMIAGGIIGIIVGVIRTVMKKRSPTSLKP